MLVPADCQAHIFLHIGNEYLYLYEFLSLIFRNGSLQHVER